jgi:hypothetical protein
MTLNFQRRGPKQYPSGRLSGDFRIHKLEKIIGGGEGKKSFLQDSVQCVLHIRSEGKLEIFVNPALMHFTKGLVLRTTIQ